jgi:hypothetical protein
VVASRNYSGALRFLPETDKPPWNHVTKEETGCIATNFHGVFMHNLKLQHIDSAVSIFDICQAHAQLESDYNMGGWLRERPSNRRRMASTGVQLHRMGFEDKYRWVDICAKGEDCNSEADEDVRDIYLINVMKLGLPMDEEMKEFIANRFNPAFVAQFNLEKH